ncbi:RDD family protein [Candidatus Poriferisodalis sp.]|uniref:RDD family protein n=1 Tax=Candidatus Poriferisodalis sp. TaxID=3101277 RepID=UPI003B027685
MSTGSQREPSMEGMRSRFIMINGAEVRLATFGERVVGRLVDAAILLTCEVVVMLAVFLPLSFLGWGHDWGALFQGTLGEAIDVLSWVLPASIAFTWLLYETVSTARGSRTLGKRAPGIEVVRAVDGTPPSLISSFWRALLPMLAGAVGALLSWRLGVWTPFQFGAAFWALVYVSAISNRHRQGWHDKLAGTVVVGPPDEPLDGGT